MRRDGTYRNADELLDHLAAELAAGRITLDQVRERLKADAERPIDLDMLGAFCAGHVRRVVAYGAMLKTVSQIAGDSRNPDARAREAEVDEHVRQMMAPLGLWREQVRTVSEFLIGLRAASGQGPVRLGEMSHATAHLLASHAMNTAAEAWQGCKDIAHRSHSDPAYLSPTTAAELFVEVHLDHLPRPNDLLALLELERAAAARALQPSRQVHPPKAPDEVTIRADAVSVRGGSVQVAAEQVALNASQDMRPKPAQRKVAVENVAAELERYRAAGGPYLDQRTLARLCGCHVATVNKAIRSTAALRDWKDAALEARKRRAAPRRDAGDFDIVAEQVGVEPETSLSDEEVDAILERLYRKARGNPQWVAALNRMSREELRRIARLYADGDYERSPLEDDSVPGRKCNPRYHGRV